MHAVFASAHDETVCTFMTFTIQFYFVAHYSLCHLRHAHQYFLALCVPAPRCCGPYEIDTVLGDEGVPNRLIVRGEPHHARVRVVGGGAEHDAGDVE